jgi:hypothetical protein
MKCNRSPQALILNPFSSFEGSLEVKLPTIWTDGEAEVRRVREEQKREDQRRERVRGKMRAREKVGKLCFSTELWLRRVDK